jgi:dUTP pyrophosphatase
MSNPKTKVRVFSLIPDATIPQYANDDDSGADIFSVMDTILPAGKPTLVSTGLTVELQSGWELQVRSKSGIAIKQGVFVFNSPGTIDEGYREEIKVILFNTTDKDIVIPAKTKIAQLVLCPVYQANFIHMDSTRRTGGFGSTGLIAKEVAVIDDMSQYDNVIQYTKPVKEEIGGSFVSMGTLVEGSLSMCG